jgi:hypothetical protein
MNWVFIFQKTSFFIALKSYVALTGWAAWQRRNVFPVGYEQGFSIPEDGILRSHRRETLKSYISSTDWAL